MPLSRHLPLRHKLFDHEASVAFFANLLPEGDIRRQVARSVGVSAENTFDLLVAIGGDCAGAVSLFPPGVTEVQAPTGTFFISLLTQKLPEI